MSKYVGVIGSASNLSKASWQLAYDIGAQIARRRGILVCGGRGGVMEAASRGAKEAGGVTVGILPGMDREDANEFIDISIPTGLGYALRNFITIRSSDVVIMVQGEVGTFSEAVLSYQHGKPLVAVETSGGWASRLRGTMLEGKYLDDRKLMEFHYAQTAEEAVEIAFGLIGTVPPPSKI